MSINFRSRGNAARIPLKKGAVQKLVLKGGWEDRRWNDRWLELSENEIRYCFEEGLPGETGKVIDHIKPAAVSRVQSLVSQAKDLYNIKSKNVPDENSIWDIVSSFKLDFPDELSACFLIATKSHDGAGREYLLRTTSIEETSDWIDKINRVVLAASPPPETFIGRLRRAIRKIYDSGFFRILVLILIFFNFMAFVYDTQVRTKPNGKN